MSRSLVRTVNGRCHGHWPGGSTLPESIVARPSAGPCTVKIADEVRAQGPAARQDRYSSHALDPQPIIRSPQRSLKRRMANMRSMPAGQVSTVTSSSQPGKTDISTSMRDRTQLRPCSMKFLHAHAQPGGMVACRFLKIIAQGLDGHAAVGPDFIIARPECFRPYFIVHGASQHEGSRAGNPLERACHQPQLSEPSQKKASDMNVPVFFAKRKPGWRSSGSVMEGLMQAELERERFAVQTGCLIVLNHGIFHGQIQTGSPFVMYDIQNNA